MLKKVSLISVLMVFCAGALFGQGARIVMETASEFALKSIPFSMGGGLFGEDSAFRYDSSTHRLSIGSSASPEATVHIQGADYPQVVVNGQVGDPEKGNIWLRFLPTDPYNFFDFSAKTVDGSDTKTMRLGGGGDVTVNRGATIELAGNEAGGSATVRSGDVGGNVNLEPAGGDIKWGKPLVALGDGPAATLGATGGSGPSSSSQHSWVRAVDSSGQAIWIPAYK